MIELHEEPRSFDTPRSLEVRLTEYRDSLRSIAEKFGEVKKLLDEQELDSSSLDDSIHLYRIIENDITVILSGEELQVFTVTGEL